jgi:hypothetical protein
VADESVVVGPRSDLAGATIDMNLGASEVPARQ